MQVSFFISISLSNSISEVTVELESCLRREIVSPLRVQPNHIVRVHLMEKTLSDCESRKRTTR
jgi:hypothetical protein